MKFELLHTLRAATMERKTSYSSCALLLMLSFMINEMSVYGSSTTGCCWVLLYHVRVCEPDRAPRRAEGLS